MATRDIPKTPGQFLFGWTKHVSDELVLNKSPEELEAKYRSEHPNEHLDTASSQIVTSTKLSSMWPAFTCGAGLFSDGYVNNSIGTVSTCLSILYPKEIAKKNALSNVASIAFAGTVLGMLVFGYVSDRISRKSGMLFTNVMLIFFTLMTAVATWGAHGSPFGLFAAITAFRFFLGVFIGAEYPTASVLSAEFANQLPAGHRNRYFCWFTTAMIDLGFVVSSFVPMVLLWIFSPRHLTAVWRLTLGLGVFPPLILFFLRLKITEGDQFKKMNFNNKKSKFPLWLIIKFYWFRLLVVSLIWFIYDFSAYSFGIFSSYILAQIIPDGDLYKTFGWNVVFNLFYIPGAFLGALAADYLGPRLTLGTGVSLQGMVGFIMAALYPKLKHHIGGFVVVYGIFSTLGEFGPGDNIGLLASKTCATPIRGQYYGIAAAVGKIGAFVGTWVFPVIIKNAGGPKTDSGNQAPYYVSSALCFFSAFLALFFLPALGQDALNKEDEDFLQYLKDNNYDISLLGDGSFKNDYTDESIEIAKNHETVTEVEKSSI